MVRKEPCPDPEVWVSWSEGGLGALERSRGELHLVSCADCRAELAALATTQPRPPSDVLRGRWASLVSAQGSRSWRRLPYAAAAAILLAALGAWWLQRPSPSASSRGTGSSTTLLAERAPAALAPVRGPLLAEAPLEVLLGAVGELAMERGARGSLAAEAGAPHVFTLEAGTAWVEAGGETLRVRVRGCDGFWELRDGELGLRAGGGGSPSALLLHSAQADDDATWAATVFRGESTWVRGADRRQVGAGETRGSSRVPLDSRGWCLRKEGETLLKDAALSLAPSGLRSPWVAEAVLRKRDRTAEAALLFSAGGRSWQMPLGAQLPAEGTVRLRIEVGGGRVRLLAGPRELLSCPLEDLPLRAYPGEGEIAWGVRAWGGDLEVKGARWRAP